MEYLSMEDRGAVRLVRIANPPRGYMNAAMAEELDAAVAEAESEDGVRALIFAGGVPGVFIRHYDVAEIVEVAKAMRSGAVSADGDRAASPVYRLIDRLSASELPTIAAIGGVCMGGGCEFALACDIRVAATGDYPIGLPETRLGIIPGIGGLQMLARVVGLARAKEMVMRGRVMAPEEALRIGLVDELAEDADAAALAIAADIADRPPQAVRTVQRMAARIAGGELLAEGIQQTQHDFAHTLTVNDDAMQAMRGFLEGGENILKP